VKKDTQPAFQAMGSTRICLHCGRYHGNRLRGLCRTCYYSPGIKEGYATRKGYYPAHAILPMDGYRYEPTACPSGSEDKIEVMRERSAYGLPLCHPQDAGYRE